MLRQRDRDYDVHEPALRGDAPKPAPWHGKDLPDGRDLKAREHVKPCLYCKHWTQFLTRYDAGLCEVGAKGKGAPAVDYLDTCDRHTPR